MPFGGIIMSAKTIDTEIDFVRNAVSLHKRGDTLAALELAETAARKYPKFVFPQVGGTFADLAAQFRAALPVEEPQESAPAPRVETQTLRLVHDGKAPTTVLGVEKDTPAHRILGRDGFKLGFYPANKGWYIKRSGGKAADLPLIARIVKALESARVDGSDTPLYRVEQTIADTNPETGERLAQSVDRAARAKWQKAYDGRMNSAQWELTFEKAKCATCPATGLSLRTGSITKDADKLPQVQCGTCTGTTPVDLTALELAAEPAPVPESATCPSCRQLVRVVDGRLDLHTKPFQSTACRGKLGVQPTPDVDPEPATAPEPKPARKATTRKAAPKAAPVVDTSDLQAELTAALMAGDNVAAAAVFVRMQERAEAAREAAKPAPKAEPTGALAEIGASWKFATVDGISGSRLKNSATDARQALPRAFRKAGMKVQTASESGVKVEIRRDRDAKTLVATVVDLPAEGVSAAKLAKIVRQVVTAQRDVVSAARNS